jgi:hemerythrin-like domain-containing protein
MAALNLNHPIFTIIKKEHKEILERLKDLKTIQDYSQLVNWLWSFVEEHHHQKEESILFDFVKDNPKLHEGGPFCVYYFDYFMNDRPSDYCQKHFGKQPEITPSQQKFYDKSSPIRIPIEEHRAGKEILSYLIKNNATLSKEDYLKYLTKYKELQELHFNKEESCFFHLCSMMITEIEADTLYQEWLKS